MRQLYLAATGMNRGKTTFALGLLAALIDRGHETGFIKPVGQRYALVDGIPADEDAILVRSVFGLPDALTVMSPAVSAPTTASVVASLRTSFLRAIMLLVLLEYR